MAYRKIKVNLKIGLAQVNTTVGDFAANCDKIRQMYARAKSANIDLLVFPELCICGYPPEDLLLKKSFLAENKKAVEQIAADCPDIAIIIGFAETGDKLPYNSLAVLEGGKITKIYRKGLLPNYGVFDEKRYFQPGIASAVIKIKGVSVVCTICEDIWDADWLMTWPAAGREICSPR